MEQVKIQKREIVIGYSVDKKSVAELSDTYKVTPKEMKDVIRACGLKVRKVEEKVNEPEPTYKISLLDSDGSEIAIKESKSEE